MTTKVQSPDGTTLYLSGAPTYQLASDYIGDPPADITYIFANHCVFLQGVVRSRELHLHTASLSVMNDNAILDSSGENGIQNITSNDQHANGSNAYSLWFSTAKFNLPTPLELKASGGDGAVGYSPPSSVPPGSGGNGGDGANVTLLVNTDFDNVADKADKIISDTSRTPARKIDDMLAWAQFAQFVTKPDSPDSISWVFNMKIDQNQPDMDPGGPLPHAINANTFMGLMAITVQVLHQTSADFMAKVDCNAGKAAHGGTSIAVGITKKGSDGLDGKRGSFTYATFTENGILNGTELLFHPDQVNLTLRDIENSYFIGTKESINDTRSKLDTLTGRLAFIKDITPTSPIFKAYAANELKKLAVLPSSTSDVPTSITSLRANFKLATQYMVQIDQGYDFYRHASTWVPRGSYTFYENAFQTVLADFDSVETNYTEYQKLAADASRRSEQVQRAQDAARSGESLANADIHTLGLELSESAALIATLQDGLPAKHKAVDDKLDELGDKIKTSFQGPTMKEMLSAAGQFCFCPEPEMAAVQGATLLSSSMSEVHDDAGNAVNKDYVVQKISTLKSGLDGLQEAVNVSADDPSLNIDDPGAAKLMGEESDIMDLVNQYRGVLGDDLDDFKTLFDDYVNTVVQRNNEVIHYNSLITVFLQTRAKVDSFQNDQDTLGAEEATLLNSDIPALASTVTASYMDYTAKVLELLYDTQRSLTFWSLDPGSVQLGLLRQEGFPSVGLGSSLKTAKGDIIKDFVDATNALGVGRQAYGVAAGPSGLPKKVVLNEWQLELLKTPPSASSHEYSATISIPVATLTSSLDDSVFASNADVRVSNVRVFLDGAKTADGILNLNLQHLGDEKIVTIHNEVKHFTHDRLVFVFEYDLATKNISRDGDIGSDPTYALPGPFATWRIGVSTTANKNLDLSNVTNAWFEFSGYSRSFR